MALLGNPIVETLLWPTREPMIANFKWQPGVTPWSSHAFVWGVAICYPIIMCSLRWLLPRMRITPLPLGPIPAAHNLVLCLGSLFMFIGTLQAIFIESFENDFLSRNHKAPFAWTLCFPIGTKSTGPVFFWAYIFYLSKYYELIDTAILVLRNKSLSFLHVFHHAVVVVVCHGWLEYQQSLQVYGQLTNSGIHVIMYLYFFLHSLGMPPPWKKFVTNAQIIQFVWGNVLSVPFLWMHFFWSEGGCAGFIPWFINISFTIALLYLFVDFHRKSYGKSKGKGKAE